MPARAILIAIAWLSLVCATAAGTLTFPALTGRVVDEAGILDAPTRASLSESLAALEDKTTDQVVVVTLKSLQGASVEDYGYRLGRHWQIGQKGKNNGVLLITVPSERKVRIEVGYGLEGTLTDAVSKFIIETSILPRFKVGDYSGGIKRGVEDIIQVLSGDAEAWQRRAVRDAGQGTRSDVDIPLAPVIIIVLIGGGALIICAMMGGALCQAILQILFLILLSRGRGSSRENTSWSGRGGTFGGGGASGNW